MTRASDPYAPTLTVGIVQWRAFNHNKEADNDIQGMFIIGVVQWRVFSHNKEADNDMQETFTIGIVQHI